MSASMGGSESSAPAKRLQYMVPERTKLHLAVFFSQFCHAGNQIFLRIALNTGVSKLVFPVYRNTTALLLLAPLAYFLEKKDRPSVTPLFLIQFFLLGLVGITLKEGFYLLGLDNTSPTFASAMQNSVPAATFLMAAILRFEQVHFARKDGIAKVLGTLASVAGASVITLYKGPTIYSSNLALHQMQLVYSLGDATGKNWTLGCIYLIGHCLCWAAWIVSQASVLQKYPAPLSVAAYTCFFGILQFLMIGAYFVRDSQAWQVNSTVELCCILYTGLVASGIASATQTWAIGKGGPVFVSVYQPVQTLLVAIMASIVLGEEFYLGGIIGAVLIIAGLYLVVWGKNEESKFTRENATIPDMSEIQQGESCDRSSLVQPLLTPSPR
ncbi:WAT1-related protein [Quillaja saponaria]|uniref:WAT1-related protein n=1 Tax=Quillaja saponaria TaxID=32244 RepID=A0AAD7P740_QUISA|nr:WAT1-related protein [Quillaja saponaria]